MNDFKINLTPRAKLIIKNAFKVAKEYNCEEVSVVHFIFSIIDSDQPAINYFLEDLSIDLYKLKSLLTYDLGCSLTNEAVKSPKISEEVDNLIRDSKSISEGFNHDYVGVEHFLQSCITLKRSPLIICLEKLNADIHKASSSLNYYFHHGHWAKPERPKIIIKTSPKINNPNDDASSNLLESYARNYNQMAKDGKFNNVVSKDFEIKKISEILCRKNKNNPILVGPPGTGKTTIVEGLAQSIVNNTCTDFLSNKVIYEIDLASMIAGTKYRGQFEDRLKKLLKQVVDSKNIILFIDEIHTLVGAGAAEGSMDAANILKPSLARGEIKCIGATTDKEYKKYITKDQALTRRLAKINIEEPSVNESKNIVHGIINKYEEFHNVKYQKKTLNLAVELSVKYLQDYRLPDKAIDILDQAGSRVKIKNICRPESAKKIEKKFDNIKPTESDIELEESLLKEYETILNKWQKELQSKNFFVRPVDIYEIISERTGIPISVIRKTKNENLKKLKKSLSSEILCQDSAIDSICNCLIRSTSGLSDQSKPTGSFLFLGRTGVGKTYMAKLLAKKFFGTSDNFIHIDMSEYSEKINISRLIGSSPGYVGHEEGGFLIEKINQKPFSVLLFDEVDKAHPSVLNILLQILDEGRLTDNLGSKAFFNNCIVILTGNIGAHHFDKGGGLGFNVKSRGEFNKQSIYSDAKKMLTPELLNRIDEVLIFNDLDFESIKKIFVKKLNFLKNLVKEKDINLSFNNLFINDLCEKVQEENMGARPINRIFQKNVENIVSAWIIDNKKGNLNLSTYENKNKT